MEPTESTTREDIYNIIAQVIAEAKDKYNLPVYGRAIEKPGYFSLEFVIPDGRSYDYFLVSVSYQDAKTGNIGHVIEALLKAVERIANKPKETMEEIFSNYRLNGLDLRAMRIVRAMKVIHD